MHITMHDMGKGLGQFILATYPALEENLPYWTVSTTRMRLAMSGPATIFMMPEWDVHVRTYSDYVIKKV